MFRVNLTLRTERTARLKDLLPRAKAKLAEKLQSEVRPLIENDVLQLLAPYPGPAVHPFEFVSDASRKKFFHMYGPDGYTRFGILIHGWRVEVSGTSAGFSSAVGAALSGRAITSEFSISVTNIDPVANLLYGPQAVPGHVNTGWGEDFPAKESELMRRIKGYVRVAWGEAVHEAFHEAWTA